MMICRGSPEYNGRYVCYTGEEMAPTEIRFWLNDHWIENLNEPNEKVKGWIGPLPVFRAPPESIPEYDL